MEEGQQGHMAQRQLLACREAVGDPVLCHLRIGVQAGAHIPLREHDALAAAGGAGGEHQHHQIIVAHAVGQLAGGSILIAVHGAELRAVGGFQLGAAAVVDAVVQDEGRLHEAQLIFQLLPGLFLVQGHEDAAGEDDAEGRHAEFIAVPAQQNDAPALDVRHFGLEIGRHPADVLRILAVLLLHDGLAVLGHIADGHMIGELLLHAAGHHVVYACGYFDVFSHRSFSFFVKFSALHFLFTFQSHSESLAFRGKLWHGSSWQQYTASRAQTQDLIAQICNLSLHSICAGRCNSFLLLRCAKSCDTLFFVRTKLHPEVESLSN